MANKIGFMLACPFRGQAIMNETMVEFLRYFWQCEDTKAQKEIVADVDPRNSVCLGLLRSSGFKELDTERKRGKRTWGGAIM